MKEEARRDGGGRTWYVGLLLFVGVCGWPGDLTPGSIGSAGEENSSVGPQTITDSLNPTYSTCLDRE